MATGADNSERAGGSSRRQFLLHSAASLSAGLAPQTVSAAQPNSDKPLRVGLIGAGLRGTYLADTVVAMARAGEPVELVAVCDIYQPRLERAEAKFGAKGYAKSADMLRDARLDAVIVATPDRHHVLNMLAAIRAGKDVYCEKPASHWSQFDKLKALVHENRKLGRMVQIGTQFLADSVWETSGELIRNGEIGKPVHAQTCYFRRGDQGECGMKIDDPDARPGVGVDWETFQADAPRRPFSASRLFQWRLYMDYSGGPLTDTYPHVVTPLFKALNPGLPERVVAIGGRYYFDCGRDVPDTFDLLIQYPQGLTVVVLGSFVNETRVDTVIRGSDGTMIKKPEGMLFEPQGGVQKNRRELPADIPARGEGHRELSVAHLKDFFQAVRSRKQPRSDLELNYTVQTALIMAMRSHLTNRAVFFDRDKEEISLGKGRS